MQELAYDSNMQEIRTLNIPILEQWNEYGNDPRYLIAFMFDNWYVPVSAISLAFVFGLNALIWFYAIYIPTSLLIISGLMLYYSRAGDSFAVAVSRLQKVKNAPLWAMSASLMVYFLIVGFFWH